MPIGAPIERYSTANVRTTAFAFSPSSTIQAGTVAILTTGSGAFNKTLSSITDSVGNPWVIDAIATAAPNFTGVSLASAQIATPITTGDTITLSWTETGSFWTLIQVQEVAGLATFSVFDKTTSGFGNSAAYASGTTAALSQADELVMAYLYIPGALGWTEEVGYTRVSSADNNSGGLQYKIVAATTGVSASEALGGSGNWGILLGTYKAPPAVVGTQNLAPVIYGRGAA